MTRIKGLPILNWELFTQSMPMRSLKRMHKMLHQFANKHNWYLSYFFSEEVLQPENAVIILNKEQKAVSVSENFSKISGYLPEDLIGRTPASLLQGEESSIDTSTKMKRALDMEVPFEARIINYRKCGRPYYSQVKSYPVFNQNHQLIHFVYFEKLAS